MSCSSTSMPAIAEVECGQGAVEIIGGAPINFAIFFVARSGLSSWAHR